MSRLSINYSEPKPQRRRGPLTALAHAILLGTCLGALGSVGLLLLERL